MEAQLKSARIPVKGSEYKKEKGMGKRPRYTEELFKKIFIMIGAAFLVLGLLSVIGVLSPTSYSEVQEPSMVGIIFFVLGIACIAAQFFLKGIASRKDKLYRELLANGTRVEGTVENVCQDVSMRYGGQSPYIIFYTYTYEGKVFHHQSPLLWDKPDVMVQDSIVVYANTSGKSAIQC